MIYNFQRKTKFKIQFVKTESRIPHREQTGEGFSPSITTLKVQSPITSYIYNCKLKQLLNTW